MTAHQSLGLLDMLLTKEELTVEVAEVDCVQINDVDLAEAGEDKILQKLAANSSSTDHQSARLVDDTFSKARSSMVKEQTCLILGYR